MNQFTPVSAAMGGQLIGLCASVATGAVPAIVFALAMVAGMLLYTKTVGRAPHA